MKQIETALPSQTIKEYTKDQKKKLNGKLHTQAYTVETGK